VYKFQFSIGDARPHDVAVGHLKPGGFQFSIGDAVFGKKLTGAA